MYAALLLMWWCKLHMATAFLALSATKRSPVESRNFPIIQTTTVYNEEVIVVTKPARVYESFPWTFESQEYNINYRVEGPVDGPPVLLIHGLGANVNHFRFQIPALANEGYRVYAIDLLGFGASDKPANVPYSIDLYRDLLQDFVDTMNAKNPWILAGNSIGGLCSLALAASLPKERVQGIALFNCSHGLSVFRYEDFPMGLRPLLYLLQKVLLNPVLLGKSFFAQFKTRGNVQAVLNGAYKDKSNVDEELLEILLEPSKDKGAEDVFLRVFGGAAGPKPEAFLAKISCPILTQWGEQDPSLPVEMATRALQQWQAMYKGASWTLDILPQASHCPHDEQPVRVHQVLLPWLKQTRETYNPGLSSN